MIYIYTLADPQTGEIRYVGKTSNLQRRYTNHLCIKSGWYVANWLKSLKEKGLKPVMEVLEECTEQSWPDAEVYWIAQLKAWGFNLTNHLNGGGAYNGSKGKTPWNKGKQGVYSKETLEKMKLSHLGRKYNLKRKQLSYVA